MLTAERKPANAISCLKFSMRAKTSLQERLEELMQALSWSEADLIRHSGASRSVVGQWLGKADRPIKTIANVTVALRLQDASGYAAAWIAQGEGAKKVPPHPGADEGGTELLRLYAQLDVVARARLLAFAADLSGKHQKRRVAVPQVYTLRALSPLRHPANGREDSPAGCKHWRDCVRAGRVCRSASGEPPCQNSALATG